MMMMKYFKAGGELFLRRKRNLNLLNHHHHPHHFPSMLRSSSSSSYHSHNLNLNLLNSDSALVATFSRRRRRRGQCFCTSSSSSSIVGKFGNNRVVQPTSSLFNHYFYDYSPPTQHVLTSTIRGRRSIHHQSFGAMLNGHSFFSTSTTTSDATNSNSNPNQQPQQQIIKKSSPEDQVADVKILQTLAKYLWLKDNLEFRLRVVIALAFLIGAKVLNVQVPFLFKLAVDWLTSATGNATALASFTTANSSTLAFFVTPAAVLVGYGIARAGASAFNEVRTAVFSKVALRTIRSVSRQVCRSPDLSTATHNASVVMTTWWLGHPEEEMPLWEFSGGDALVTLRP